MSAYGVIDLGTNTFHLLIAEPLTGGGFREHYRERRFIKLAEAGIEHIGPAPYSRGIETMRHFKQLLDAHGVTRLRAIGTAALRTAANGPAFIREVADLTGIAIETISGREEARLITRGVQQALPPIEARYLIMDIGGGSVEFIIAGNGEIQWAESFPIGVAVLYKNFHRTEPIRPGEIDTLWTWLTGQLAPLAARLRERPVHWLIGAAGTFDVIGDLLASEHPTSHASHIDLTGFQALYDRVTAAGREARHTMPGIPDDRADMIVVALVLVDFILHLANIERLTVSNFSMKEGILAEMVGTMED
jgi:exopolyphosphatase / guanosine-5'-triphosphate,3'-diphosphate pyrophosphatase